MIKSLMKNKVFALGIIITSMVLTSCAPLESNYNKYEQQIVSMQGDMLDDLDIVKKNFYDYNKIKHWHAHGMPESMYLVYYHSIGGSEEEEGFERILKNYIEDTDSIRLYISEVEKEGEIRIEFITRVKNDYKIENIWYNYSEIDYLPYKKKS